MKKLIAVAFLLCLAAPALAHNPDFPYPLLAKERLTIGARVEHAWYSGEDNFLVNEVEKEFGVGVVGAYALTGGQYPLSLIGGTVYAMDSKWFRSYVGINVRLFSGRGD